MPPKKKKAEQDDLPGRALRALRDEQDEALGQLCALGLDALLALPLEQLVDLDVVLGLLDLACEQRFTAGLVEAYAKPAAARERARAAASAELGQAWWTEETAARMEEILRQSFPLNPQIIDDLVDQRAVRAMLGNVLQEALQAFVQSSKLPGLGSAASMVGSIGRRASRGILGGLKSGLEGKLESTVSDFVDQSMSRITRKVAEIASTEASRKMQGAMRADLFAKARRTPVTFYYEELAKVPAEELWALLPPVLAHNLARPEIREAILGEVRAAIQREAGRPAVELLRELGVEGQVRALAQQAALPHARAIVGAPAFGQWLAALLER